VRYLAHFGYEYLIVARIGYRTVETREYLRSIANHETAEVFLKYFHAVFIDQLERTQLASQISDNSAEILPF
jgi:hypothetical protein